jgi:hypothetical protein
VYKALTERGPVMSDKTRTIAAIALGELMLAGVWIYLANLAATHPDRVSPGFGRVVGATMGTAMGVFLGLGVLLYFIATRHNRG